MRRALLLAVALWGRVAAAQSASPYLPLDHWATPYLEHLIARGVVVDPTPLTRPWHEAAILQALKDADTTAMSAGEREMARTILDALASTEAGPHGRLDGDLGTSVASSALRDPLELDRGGPSHDPKPARGF